MKSRLDEDRGPAGSPDNKIRIAKHAVYRAFAMETVVLNVKSGTYHGLNPTAGRMLVVLNEADNVGAAVQQLAAEYGVPAAQVEQDIAELCERLGERGLIEVTSGSDGD